MFASAFWRFFRLKPTTASTMTLVAGTRVDIGYSRYSRYLPILLPLKYPPCKLGRGYGGLPAIGKPAGVLYAAVCSMADILYRLQLRSAADR